MNTYINLYHVNSPMRLGEHSFKPGDYFCWTYAIEGEQSEHNINAPEFVGAVVLDYTKTYSQERRDWAKYFSEWTGIATKKYIPRKKKFNHEQGEEDDKVVS